MQAAGKAGSIGFVAATPEPTAAGTLSRVRERAG